MADISDMYVRKLSAADWYKKRWHLFAVILKMLSDIATCLKSDWLKHTGLKLFPCSEMVGPRKLFNVNYRNDHRLHDSQKRYRQVPALRNRICSSRQRTTTGLHLCYRKWHYRCTWNLEEQPCVVIDRPSAQAGIEGYPCHQTNCAESNKGCRVYTIKTSLSTDDSPAK